MDFATIVFTFVDIINPVLSVFEAISCVALFYFYYRTKILDYLLFGLYFFIDVVFVIAFGPFGVLNGFVSERTHSNILNYTLYIAVLLLFIHALRTKWEKPPKLLLYPVLVLFGYIFVMIAFSDVRTDVNYPVKLLGINIFNVLDDPYQGILVGNIVLFERDIFWQFVRPFVYFLTAYAYLTSDYINLKAKDMWARNVWIISFIMVGITNIFIIPDLLDPNYSFGLRNVVTLAILFLVATIGYIIPAFIALFTPQAILLPKINNLRATLLYNQFKDSREIIPGPIGVNLIKSYLERSKEIVEAEILVTD